MQISFEEKGGDRKIKNNPSRKRNDSTFGFVLQIVIVSLCIDVPVWAYFHFVEKTTVFQGIQNLGRKIRGEDQRVVYRETEKRQPAKPQPQSQVRREEIKPTPPKAVSIRQDQAEQMHPWPKVEKYTGAMDQAEADYIMAVNLLRNDRIPEAIEYYRKSARAGNIKAQRALAELANRER